MSLLQKLEDNIEHVYGVFKHILQHQIDNFGGACNETKEVVEAIEAHMAVQKDANPAVVAPPTVTLVDNTALTNQTIGEPATNTITTATAQ